MMRATLLLALAATAGCRAQAVPPMSVVAFPAVVARTDVVCEVRAFERVAMSMACWPAADFTGQNVPVWFNGTWAWPNEKASATAVHYSNFTLTDEGRFLPGENVVAPAAPDAPPARADTLQVNAKQVQIGAPGYMPTVTFSPFDLPYGFGIADAALEYTKQDTYQTYYCDVVTATLSYMRVFLGPDGYLGYFGC